MTDDDDVQVGLLLAHSSRLACPAAGARRQAGARQPARCCACRAWPPHRCQAGATAGRDLGPQPDPGALKRDQQSPSRRPGSRWRPPLWRPPLISRQALPRAACHTTGAGTLAGRAQPPGLASRAGAHLVSGIAGGGLSGTLAGGRGAGEMRGAGFWLWRPAKPAWLRAASEPPCPARRRLPGWERCTHRRHSASGRRQPGPEKLLAVTARSIRGTQQAARPVAECGRPSGVAGMEGDPDILPKRKNPMVMAGEACHPALVAWLVSRQASAPARAQARWRPPACSWLGWWPSRRRAAQPCGAARRASPPARPRAEPKALQGNQKISQRMMRTRVLFQARPALCCLRTHAREHARLRAAHCRGRRWPSCWRPVACMPRSQKSRSSNSPLPAFSLSACIIAGHATSAGAHCPFWAVCGAAKGRASRVHNSFAWCPQQHCMPEWVSACQVLASMRYWNGPALPWNAAVLLDSPPPGQRRPCAPEVLGQNGK